MRTNDDRVGGLVDDYLARRIDRSQFLRRALVLGLSLPAASAILAACGGIPASDIFPVADTVIVRPDPVPVAA